jgi:NAD+ synthase (glutamine-hydrolysing)
MLKITAAQLNFTVGDLTGNVAKMVSAANKAWTDQSDVVVFSEMSLTAYYPGDMLDEEGFMARIEAAFQSLLLASRQIPNLYWVVGLPTRHDAPGKKLRNSLSVIKGGEVLLEYAKQLLPTYNIFDERRHFEPGQSRCVDL